MKQLILVFAFALPFSVQAKDLPIKVSAYSYPSPASTHLDILQQELAQEAIKACGSAQAVLGVSNIKIEITNGLNKTQPVGQLDAKNVALNLWYPQLDASATVSCQ